MVEPTRLGAGAGLAAGAASGTTQRKLRKMSGHPEEPRVFSQAKILVPLGLVASVVMTLVMYFPISDYVAGRSNDIFSIIIPGLITLFSYVLLLHGLFRRFGVDREKVWTKFGALLRKEVRFDQIDRFGVGFQQYKLYAGDTKVNIDYNRFDYSLVFIRLLEELQVRRFKLQNVDIDDPQWEDTAQAHRNMFASDVFENHRAFYETHPEELDKLQALIEPPTSYSN